MKVPAAVAANQSVQANCRMKSTEGSVQVSHTAIGMPCFCELYIALIEAPVKDIDGLASTPVRNRNTNMAGKFSARTTTSWDKTKNNVVET